MKLPLYCAISLQLYCVYCGHGSLFHTVAEEKQSLYFYKLNFYCQNEHHHEHYEIWQQHEQTNLIAALD